MESGLSCYSLPWGLLPAPMVFNLESHPYFSLLPLLRTFSTSSDLRKNRWFGNLIPCLTAVKSRREK